MRMFFLVVTLVVPPMQAQAVFTTGNDLVAQMRAWEKFATSQAEANAYQAGIYDGYVIAAADANEAVDVICIPDKTTRGQVWASVAGWLKSHPTELHKDAIGLVGAALKQAFPCE
jgi:hypothetical protein